MLRVAIVAGEPSGDQLGAELITSLRQQNPDVTVHAMAGPRMREAGCTELASIEALSVMGVVEVLRHYPRLRALREHLVRALLDLRPHVFIGIDVPDFVLEIERRLRGAGVPTVHYVCPQVWAWRPGRIAKIRSAADRVLTLFPFEAPFLARHGVHAHFVGHPLARRLPLEIDRRAARERCGIEVEGPLVALLPGSRRQEYLRHLPLFLAAASALHDKLPEVRCVVGAVDARAEAHLMSVIAASRPRVPLHIVTARSTDVLSAADAALCVSGTITLEAALAKAPAVVAYRMPWLTYAVLRRLVTTRWIALPNIIAGRELVPERIQDAATPEALSAALARWLTEPAAVAEYRDACLDLHAALRNNAGATAADVILGLVSARGFRTEAREC